MKNKKLISGCVTLAGLVAVVIAMFVPYLKVVVKTSGFSGTEKYTLFNENILHADGQAWLTISKIAIITLAVALLVAGLVMIYSSLTKKTPNWVSFVGVIAGLVAVVATIVLAGGMIGFGSANRTVSETLGSVKLWGSVGFYLALVGGAVASVFAVLPYFKKK